MYTRYIHRVRDVHKYTHSTTLHTYTHSRTERYECRYNDNKVNLYSSSPHHQRLAHRAIKRWEQLSQNRVYCVEKKVSAININAGIIGQYHYQNIYFLSSLLLWLSVTCNSTDNTNTTLAEKKLQNTLKKKHSHSVPVLSCQKIEAEEHRINIKHTTLPTFLSGPWPPGDPWQPLQ